MPSEIDKNLVCTRLFLPLMLAVIQISIVSPVLLVQRNKNMSWIPLGWLQTAGSPASRRALIQRTTCTWSNHNPSSHRALDNTEKMAPEGDNNLLPQHDVAMWSAKVRQAATLPWELSHWSSSTLPSHVTQPLHCSSALEAGTEHYLCVTSWLITPAGRAAPELHHSLEWCDSPQSEHMFLTWPLICLLEM